MEQSSVRVVLADDHQVVRRGIKDFLLEGGIEVLAEAENGNDALSYILDLQPDVAVLDIQMPGRNGIEVVKAIREHGLSVGLLILTAYDDDPFILAAIKAGVNGYVLKTADAEEIVDAVLAVYEGKSVLDAALVGKVMNAAVGMAEHKGMGIEALSKREIEVLHEAAKGLTNKAIGVKLRISDRTVQGHLRKTYEKLNVSNRTEAVVKAAQLDLLTLPD